MSRTADHGFATAVLDREDHTIALVEVKAHPEERWATILPRQLAKSPERVAFILAVDPNSIRVYGRRERASGSRLRLDTEQILQHYDPGFAGKRVFEPYLLTLVEAWLRDLAYHWKSEDPPGSEELAKTGLLEKLEGGTTQRPED